MGTVLVWLQLQTPVQMRHVKMVEIAGPLAEILTPASVLKVFTDKLVKVSISHPPLPQCSMIFRLCKQNKATFHISFEAPVSDKNSLKTLLRVATTTWMVY